MAPANTSNALPLTKRHIDSMDRAIAGVFDSWVLKLRSQLGESAEDGLKVLEDDRRRGQDLWSLAPRLLRPDVYPGDEDVNVLIANVRRKEYSISDLFIQLGCLEEAIEESLRRDYTGGPEEAGILMGWIRTRFRAVFRRVLNETSMVYESFAEAGSAYCHMDVNGAIQYANEEMCRLLGVEQAAGLRLADFFGSEAAAVSDAVRGKHGRKPLIRQLSLVSRSGTRVCVHAEIAPLFINGRKRGAYATLSDMTPFMELQKRVFDKSPLGIIRVNRNLEFTYANPTALEMTGASRIEDVNIWDIVPDAEDRKILKDQFARRMEGKSDEYEIKIRRVDDHRSVPVRIAATPEFDNLDNMIGALSIVRNCELEDAIEAFHRHIETCRDWEQLLLAAATETARIVPYDLFIVSIYTGSLRQARVIFDYPKEERLEWPKRWFTLSKELVDLMSRMSMQAVGDLNAVLDRPEMQQFRQEKEVRLFVDRGIRSFIRIPVLRGEKPLAAVTLLSRRPDAFEGTVEKLKVLPIDEIVNTAIYYLGMEEQHFRFELMKRISNSQRVEEVMDVIVQSLVKYYGWQDVSIFRVDEVERHFLLQAQAHSEDGFAYDESLTLDFGEGVLGEVYRNKEAMNIGNVLERPNFVRAREKTRSELCIPIHLAGKVQWLLNVEDDVENAFSDEDRDALQGVVDEAHSILEHLFAHFFLDEFIARSSDAIFVTDKKGRVVRTNEAAARLLGSTDLDTIIDRRLDDFLAEEDKGRLDSDAKSIRGPCRLVAVDGQSVEVFLSGGELHEDFGCKVFCARDISLIRRVKELEDIRDMFHEIAIQTRTPLALLFTWLRRLRDRVEDTSAGDLLEKAMRQLRKVELTYEQLILYDSEKGAIPFNPVRLDILSVLTMAKEELPRSDSDRIVVETRSPRLPQLRGDLFQLIFVFQAVLSYLLRFAPVDERIPVSVEPTESAVEIRITGLTPARGTQTASSGNDRLVESRADMDIALGETIIRRFIETNHHGRYAPRAVPEGMMEFLITLPTI